MATVKDVIRNALLKIQQNGQLATPDVYSVAFYEEAKKLGVNIEGMSWKTSWLKQLDSKTRNQIQTFPIKTQEDFIRFLGTTIAKLREKDTKESYLLYRELLALFLHNYLTNNPTTNPNLIKDTKSMLDGNTQLNMQLIKERWNVLLKSTKETKPIVQQTDNIEREENLAFFAPLLRPSLTNQHEKHQAINEAKTMLQQDLENIVKNKLVSVLDKALQERVRVDKSMLVAAINKHSNELEHIFDVVIAKITSLQFAGEMMFNEIAESNKQLTHLTPEENNLLKFKEDMLSLLNHSEQRFQHIQKSMSQTKNGLDSIAIKFGGEARKRIEPNQDETDSLTGVYTMEAIAKPIAYHENLFIEYQQSYSVFYIDIDNFENVNIKHGNESGDKILATFGKLLKSIVRSNDYVVRVEGEEFLIFLAGMDQFDSSYFAEKIRAQIAESTFVYGQHKMQISVTIGVADRNEAENFESVLNCAKRRASHSKQLGYNRIATEG